MRFFFSSPVADSFQPQRHEDTEKTKLRPEPSPGSSPVSYTGLARRQSRGNLPLNETFLVHEPQVPLPRWRHKFGCSAQRR